MGPSAIHPRHWLWPDRLPRARSRKWLLVLAQYGYALIRDYLTGELSIRAASLVYTSIFGLVPLLAFSFSVLKGLGFHRQMEPLLQRFFAPFGAQAPEITNRIIGFVDNVSGSVLASVSLGLLLLTALSMAQQVEDSFNFVWRVSQPRSLARRFSNYLSVLLIGPLLMMIAMGIIAAVSQSAIIGQLRAVEPLGTWLAALGEYAPFVLIIAAFTFLYAFLPNAAVRWRSALVGGVFAGTLWVASGQLFTMFFKGTSRTHLIYSGFAVVILAIFWLYLSWLILLLGAQLAFYHQNPYCLRTGRRVPDMSSSLRERLALMIMLLVGREFERPDKGWSAAALAREIQTSRDRLEPLLAALRRARLLTTTSGGRLIPAKDLRHIALAEILLAVRAPAHDDAGCGGTVASVTTLGARIDEAIGAALGDQSLADLIESTDERSSA
jgi:membrane protein